MLNLKKIFAAATLTVAAMASANAFEVSLDNFQYEPNVSIAVDGDTNSILSLIDPTITTPLLEATATAQTINPLIAADVDFTLTLISDENGGETDFSDLLSISSVAAGAGSLTFSESAGVQAELEVVYSGTNNAALDASPFTAFYFDLSEDSGDEGFQLALEFLDTDGNSEVLKVLANELNVVDERVTVPYTEISDLVNLTSLASISATISSPGVFADLILVDLGFINVPEPTTLAIFGLALLGFGVRRRNA